MTNFRWKLVRVNTIAGPSSRIAQRDLESFGLVTEGARDGRTKVGTKGKYWRLQSVDEEVEVDINEGEEWVEGVDFAL